MKTPKRPEDGKNFFVFQNNTGKDLSLPGLRGLLQKDTKFKGSDYYLTYVPKMLKVIKALPNVNTEIKKESVEVKKDLLNEGSVVSDKLITEQPPTVTTEGKVEFVEVDKKSKKTKLHETNDEAQVDILLNEYPANDSDLELI